MLTLHNPEYEDEPLPRLRCTLCHQRRLTRGGSGGTDWWHLGPTASPGATQRTWLTKTMGCRYRKIHRPEDPVGLGVAYNLGPQLFLMPAHTHLFIVRSLDLGNLGVRTSLQPHPGSSKALWVRDHGYWLPWVTKVTRVLGYNHSTYLWSWGSLLCSSVSTGHVCTGHGTRAFGSTWQNLLDRGRTPTVLKG